MCRRDTATQFSNETLISIYWRLFIICFYLPSCASAFPDLLERPEFSSGLSNCLNSFYCRQFVNKLQAIKKYTTSLLVQSSLIVKPIWICDVQVTILLDVKESETVVCARGISILRIRHVCFGIGHLVSKNIEKHLMLLDSHKKKKNTNKMYKHITREGSKDFSREMHFKWVFPFLFHWVFFWQLALFRMDIHNFVFLHLTLDSLLTFRFVCAPFKWACISYWLFSFSGILYTTLTFIFFFFAIR